MAKITIGEVRARAAQISRKVNFAAKRLYEWTEAVEADREFDIFLSHSSSDAEIILGTIAVLEDMDYSVYVDWIVDSALDRANVDPRTAKILQGRMEQCKCLVYAATSGSSSSKWMPWETGYFDGAKGRVAILPITQTKDQIFRGAEFLGLYPYIERDPTKNSEEQVLWVQWSEKRYVRFDAWLKGRDPMDHK